MARIKTAHTTSGRGCGNLESSGPADGGRLWSGNSENYPVAPQNGTRRLAKWPRYSIQTHTWKGVRACTHTNLIAECSWNMFSYPPKSETTQMYVWCSDTLNYDWVNACLHLYEIPHNKQIHTGERQIRSVLIRGDRRWPVGAKGCEISLRSYANHLVLLGFNCQLDSLGSERGSLNWGISQGRGACEHVYGETVCTNNWYRCFQPPVGNTIPRKVVLGCIKNLANQESAHERVRSLLPWFLLLEFLLWLPAMMNYDLEV